MRDTLSELPTAGSNLQLASTLIFEYSSFKKNKKWKH